MVAGAAVGVTTVLAFGHIADALAATLPGSDAVVAVGGAQNPTSDRIKNKFGGEYVPYHNEFVGVDDSRFFGVGYPAALPVDPSVAEGRQPLIDKVAEARATVGEAGTIYIVSYSEGTIVAEKYKRELDAQGSPDSHTLEFVSIAAPTVPNGGIYARFPNLRLPGYTSTGAAEPSPYGETFITIEYDPVGDFPAYANPLSVANALAGMVYLHGDTTPDATNLNDPNATIVKHFGNDTYILVKTEHLPLLQPIRDVSTALHTEAFTEPVLGAIEPTLKLGVDMGYTDRDYSHAAAPTRFSLITPPERIVETLNRLPVAIQQGADNFKGGLPSTTSGSTDRMATKKAVTRIPAQRRDDMRNTVSGIAKNVKDSFKPKPMPKPMPKAKTQPKSKPEPATDKAA
jgi:PE-PPE domain